MADQLTLIAQGSQIVVAILTVGVVIFAFLEYRKSQKTRRIDLALDALKNWDNRINHLTNAGINVLVEIDKDPEIAFKIKECRRIQFKKRDITRKRYGFLLSETGEIDAATVNEIRLSLIHFLNAWEFIAVLYNSNRADRPLIESQLLPGQYVANTISILKPFMDLYGDDSWKPFRVMAKEIGDRDC